MVMLEDVLGRLFDLNLMLVIAGSAVYGLVLGAIPGLTALMASALLVPIIIFMDPIPAVAAIITASAMAIFAGDIPGALMRMPGTPASAAYTDDAYGLTRSGHAALALGAGLFASATGGLASAVVLVLAAPLLADIALSFSSVEYFWLTALGLSCATFVAGPSLLRGMASLLLGLAFAMVGMDPVSGAPRFTFGFANLLGGLGLIPVLIGMFAVSELLRGALADPQVEKAPATIGPIMRGIGPAMWKHRIGLLRGSGIGTLVGALPGAGSDIAAWISYAVARRGSRMGRRDDRDGAIERIMSASAANNASLGGAYIPATVFGIPGDAITAIVISVMFLKGISPGPTLFLNDPGVIYSIFAIFFIANILVVPLGILSIRAFGAILRLPAAYVSPTILVFCILGAFSVDNTLFAVGVIGVIGVLGYLMEANRIPIAPAILGLILGPLIEQTFMTTMLKSNGDLTIFFERPIGGTLGVVTIVAWVVAMALHLLPSRRSAEAPVLR